MVDFPNKDENMKGFLETVALIDYDIQDPTLFPNLMYNTYQYI